MLRTEFEYDEHGMTVPYPPLFDQVRRNHGFVDLRGRSDLATKIPEVRDSLALKELLVRLADDNSPVFSLGCDLGTHTEPWSPPDQRHVAGGYVQLMHVSYSDRSPEDYRLLGDTAAHQIESLALEHNWLLRFIVNVVQFNLDGFCSLAPSVWIWFYAAALTPQEALESREALISKLGPALTGERIKSLFE